MKMTFSSTSETLRDGSPRSCRPTIEDLARADDPQEARAALVACHARELKRLAREMLRLRADECIEILRGCESCRALLASGGYDPVHLLSYLRDTVGRRGARMDIAPEGGGGAQRDQGYDTWIRFGAREFLTGTSLAGMTVPESQLQVILHELAHAAGDVIPPDGGDPAESVRNQHRITRACLPAVYRRIAPRLTPPLVKQKQHGDRNDDAYQAGGEDVEAAVAAVTAGDDAGRLRQGDCDNQK